MLPLIPARRKVRFPACSIRDETADAALDDLVAQPQGGRARGDDAELDFKQAPVPVVEAAVGEVEGDGLEVQDRADDAAGADDDTEAHEAAERDFGFQRHLHFPEDEDGEGGEGEIGDGGDYCGG